MQRWLDGLPVRLGAYEEIALEQRRRASSARSLLHDQNLLAERENLKRSMNVQAQQVAQLRADTPERSDRWMLRLADGEERKLISRLSAMRELVARTMPAEARKRWLERIARLEGVLFWQLVDESSGRIRNLEKTLQGNVELLSRVDLRIQRVQISETQFAAGVETDFLAFSNRAADISVEVDTALSNREVALASQLKHGMQREMREVQQYLLVTRIAIARATDQLAMAEVRVVN
jgi:hypothetical protein